MSHLISEAARTAAIRASELYETVLRKELESEHFGRFVCIEPQSGEHFLGDSLDEAVNQALDADPDRLTHTIRVGYPAALHMEVIVE